MDETHQKTAVEQRRTLLKGALGASTVMTLGYGGAAAAASLTCIAKVDGGYPLPEDQFVMGANPPPGTGTGWAWKRVDVYLYNSNGNTNGTCTINTNNFEGFLAAGNVYRVPTVAAPTPTLVPGAVLKTSCGFPYPKTAWVLAYFDENGIEIGTYPTYTAEGVGFAPAAQSCLTSINPQSVANYTFGG